MWRDLVPLIEITAIFVRLRLRRPPATPASDARQSPASDAHHRHGPARKQWAMPGMGILGPLNTARHGRIYRTAAKHHRPAAAAVLRRFLVLVERPLHGALSGQIATKLLASHHQNYVSFTSLFVP